MAGIVVTFTADEARLWNAQQRLIRQAAEWPAKYKKTADEAKKAAAAVGEAGKKQDKSFGSRALGQVMAMAGGYAAVNKVLAFGNQLLQENARLKREAAMAGQQASGGLAQLAQLTSDPAKLKQLQQASRQSFREGGFQDLGQAADFVFALESAGALGERKLFSGLAASQLVRDPAMLARSTATIQTALGKKETGNLRAIISKGFAASEIAPATVDQLLEAAAGSGGSARALGMSDEEILTATAVLAKSAGSASEGGTQLSAFLRALDKHGADFKGLSVEQALTKIEGMGLEGEELQTFFGRHEGLKAYRTLQLNRGLYASTLGNVQTAAERDLAGQRMALAQNDPTVRAAQMRRRAEAAVSMQNETIGQEENLIEAVQAARRSHMSAARQTWENVLFTGVRGGTNLGELFGMENLTERTVLHRFIGSGGTTHFEARNAQEAQLVLRVFERLEQLGEKWDAAAENMRKAAQQQADYSHGARNEAAAAKAD